MRKHQELSLEQIIEQVRVDKLVSDDFCIYGKEDGEQLIDVLSVALEEKPEASHQDLVEALNYYQQHDSFIKFED